MNTHATNIDPAPHAPPVSAVARHAPLLSDDLIKTVRQRGLTAADIVKNAKEMMGV